MPGHGVEQRGLAAAPHEGDDVALLCQKREIRFAQHHSFSAAMAICSGVMGSS